MSQEPKRVSIHELIEFLQDKDFEVTSYEENLPENDTVKVERMVIHVKKDTANQHTVSGA